jgi:hypothetical protein
MKKAVMVKRVALLAMLGVCVPLVMAQDSQNPAGKSDEILILDGLKSAPAKRAATAYQQAIDRATQTYNKAAEGARKTLIMSLEQAGKAAEQGKDKEEAKAINEMVAKLKVGQIPTVAGGAGPVGAVPYKDKWYRVVLGNFSWNEAKADAEATGGRLVCIGSEDEAAFCAKLTGRSVRVWVGASDDNKEGDWRWLDGTAVKKDLWAGGEPNNGMGQENWAEMRHNGKINDTFKNDRNEGYIMEFPRAGN